MLLVPHETLRPGMTVGRPILHPDRDELVLLTRGFVLDQHTIEQLGSLGVTDVWIHVPGFEDVQAEASDEVDLGRMELYRVLSRSLRELEPRVSVRLDVKAYRGAVHDMLCGIIDHPEHEVVLRDLLNCGPRLARHMANCTYLALLLGAHLAGYLRRQRKSVPREVAENTAQLGLGTLLHDVGKLNLPEDLRTRTIMAPEARTAAYRFHVTSGYDMVREHVSPVAANVVLHHHERFDGSGFPGRDVPSLDRSHALGGTKIHVFSRIAAVVDVFDHLLCRGARPVPTIMAIHGLKSERFRAWFDPVIVEALLRLVYPFVVGSIVRLSNGTEAAVVENHPEAPCRPTVRPVRSSANGYEGARRDLDLRTRRELSVAEVDGIDVRPYLFTGEFEPTLLAS